MSLKDDLQLLADDNAEAHTAINECIKVITDNLVDVKNYMQNIPTPDKVYYKPKGGEDYLDLRGNFDLIYSKLEAIEKRLDGSN